MAIYQGVGIPETQSPQAALQSFSAVPDYQGMYTGPSAPGYTQGGSVGAPGSTSASGFNPLGGPQSSRFYLSGDYDKRLRSKTLDPFQASAQLGGGQVRSEDIGALRRAQNNSQDNAYSAFASHGINPNAYLADYRQGNYNGAGQFFQQQSQKGALGGVNYGIDPNFGLTGSIGDLNFDVMKYDPRLNGSAFYNAYSPYTGTGNGSWGSTMDSIYGGLAATNGLQNAKLRDFQYQGGQNYNPDGTINSYNGSYGTPKVASEYKIPNTGLYATW